MAKLGASTNNLECSVPKMHLDHTADMTRGHVGSTPLIFTPLKTIQCYPHGTLYHKHNISLQKSKAKAFNAKMKGSSCLANTHNLYYSLPCQNRFPCNVNLAKVRNLAFKVDYSFWSNHTSCSIQQRRDNVGFVVGCGSWNSVAELERELEAEMNTQEDGARFGHKCGEGKGMVEMLECLEREAIMGEDVGKAPADYNRRAQIFDRSSRVFQALKELNHDVLS